MALASAGISKSIDMAFPRFCVALRLVMAEVLAESAASDKNFAGLLRPATQL
jgi:hypothetical protein